jgi:hypothetical protein
MAAWAVLIHAGGEMSIVKGSVGSRIAALLGSDVSAVRAALSARLASLSVHSVGGAVLLRLRYLRNVNRFPSFEGSGGAWFVRPCLRKRKQIEKSSSDKGVAAFCDARCVMVVKGWSCRTEEPEW